MNESNLKAHLESCRERVQNQNTVNLFFSTIAISITTLSLTLFGIGASLANEDAREVVLVGILGGCLLVVSVTCLGFIIRPRNWFLPCDLEESEELAFTSKAKEEFLVSLVRAYREATEYNEVVLRRKATRFTVIIVLMLIEVLCFAVLVSF